jgi:surface antigen
MLAATIFISSEPALAGDAPACTCPEARDKVRPKFADLPGVLDERDEIAALESVQLALSRMGDGTAFVWRLRNGRLAGVVRPTSSFRSQAGAVCRHLELLLTTGAKTRKTEGIACRLANGRWQLEG